MIHLSIKSLLPSFAWISKSKWYLIAFFLFIATLFFIVANLSDPTLFFILGIFGIVPLYFLFKLENFFEVLFLVIFIFIIEILNNSIGAEALITGLGLIIWITLIRTLMQGPSQWQDKIFLKEILFFIGVAFISLFTGVIILNGLRLFGINLVLGLSIFLITHFTCASFKSLHYLTFFVILFLFLNSLYGIAYFIENQNRAISFFIDTPTYSGHFFVQGIALSTGAYFCPAFKNIQKSLIGIIFFLLIALFLTLTRAAWIAFFLLVIISLFFTNIPKRYIFSGILVFSILFIFAFFYLRTEELLFMIKERVSYDVKNANIGVGSIAFRVLLAQSAWEIFIKNPFLGIGFDNFVAINSNTTLFPIIKALGGKDLYVHNVYLQIMAEMGIVGIIAFLNLIRVVYKYLSKMLTATKFHEYRFLLLGWSGAFTLWLFMALTEASLYTPTTATVFFLYLGIFSGFRKLFLNEGIKLCK